MYNTPVFLFDKMFMSISFNLNPFLQANRSPRRKCLEQDLPVCHGFCLSELHSAFNDHVVPRWETDSLQLHRNTLPVSLAVHHSSLGQGYIWMFWELQNGIFQARCHTCKHNFLQMTVIHLDSMWWFSHRHRTGRWHNTTRLPSPRTASKKHACGTFSFFPGELDLWPPKSNLGEIFVQCT